MRVLIGLVLLTAAANATDSDYNGQWDLTTGAARRGAWWVELKEVGTPNAAGKFVSAYAGDMNKIDEISVVNGGIKWAIKPPNEAAYVYIAMLAGGRLEGTMTREGQGGAGTEFTGVRAPAINEKDDGTWKKRTPVELFDGKSLSGWHALVAGAEIKWSVTDGVLKNASAARDIVSDRDFWNFDAHVEFRIVERSNSGVGLRGRYEVQILDDYWRPPNTHGAAALYSRVAPTRLLRRSGILMVEPYLPADGRTLSEPPPRIVGGVNDSTSRGAFASFCTSSEAPSWFVFGGPRAPAPGFDQTASVHERRFSRTSTQS